MSLWNLHFRFFSEFLQLLLKLDKCSLNCTSLGSPGKHDFTRTKKKGSLNARNPSVDHAWETLVLDALIGFSDFRNVNWPAYFSVGNYVSHFEITNLRFDAQVLRDVSNRFPGHLFRVLFRLGTNDDHFAGFEDEDSAFGISLSQNDGRKSLFVVPRIFHFFSNKLQIKFCVLHAHPCEGDNILNDRSLLSHCVFWKNIFLYFLNLYIDPAEITLWDSII